MHILTLTGGRCIYYLSNNLATRRKMFNNSCHFSWDVYFSVFSGSMSLLLHLELNLKQHFRCGKQTFKNWGMSLEVYHGDIFQFKLVAGAYSITLCV